MFAFVQIYIKLATMEWTDHAIMLSARPHGETAALVVLLTRDHGRHAGLVHGGQSSRQRATLEPGARVAAHWRARLSDQLGHYALELERATAAPLLDEPDRLACLISACALVDTILPEREPHPALYDATLALFDTLLLDVWAEVYVRWEVGLLEEAGFGLDFSRCAATGRELGALGNETLTHVSPRTGRAVSTSAAEPFKDKLLPLPPFLLGLSAGGPAEVKQGLDLTGYFLERFVFAQRHVDLPPARRRFVERYTRQQIISGMDGA